MTQREEFEAWAKIKHLDVDYKEKDAWGREIYTPHIQSMWTGWQAAQAAQPADYDTWAKHPYTLVLQKSIEQDYVPRTQPAHAHAIDTSPGRVEKRAGNVQVPGWIPVGERLPEVDSGEVLVWLTGGRCAFDEWHQHHEDPIGLGGGTMYMGDMWRDYEFDEITHWMPLPAAPSTKEQSNG